MDDPTDSVAPTTRTDAVDVVVCPLLALELDAGPGSGAPASTTTGGAGRVGRCTATMPAVIVAGAQRGLVCETADHVDCPRYARAARSSRPPAAIRAARGAGTAVATGAVIRSAGDVAADPPASAPATYEGDAPDQVAPAGALDGPPGAPAAGAPPDDDAPDALGDPIGPEAATPEVLANAEIGDGDGPRAEPERIVPVRPMTHSRGRSGARPAGSRPLPIVVAGSILVACLVIAFAFTSLRGGLALPVTSPTVAPSASSPATVATPIGSADVGPVASPSTSASGTGSPTPTATPEVSPAPTVAPSPRVPAAYAGLEPCPDRAACYLYRIRSGDSLTKLATRFGITLAALRAANPKVVSPSLIRVGQVLRVPLPRR